MDERSLITANMVGWEFHRAMADAELPTGALDVKEMRKKGWRRFYIACGLARIRLDVSDGDLSMSMDHFSERHVRPYVEELKLTKGR